MRSGRRSDNPDLIVACVIAREAETGPLAASCHSTTFLNRRTMARAADPAPERIQIANPRFCGIPREDWRAAPRLWSTSRLRRGHRPDAGTPEEKNGGDIRGAGGGDGGVLPRQISAHSGAQERRAKRPRWPWWCCERPGLDRTEEVDGQETEGSWRSHQVPISDMTKSHSRCSTSGMRSYRPQELFDYSGHPRFGTQGLSAARNSAHGPPNPHANGEALVQGLAHARLPSEYTVRVLKPGQTTPNPRGDGALLRT